MKKIQGLFQELISKFIPIGITVPSSFKTLLKFPNLINNFFRRYDGDIALIEMQVPVQFSQFLQRIALPKANNQPIPGNKGFVVGYGSSEKQAVHENIPKRIEIPIVDSETCYQSHDLINRIKSRDSFCAGKPGVVPCNGWFY